MKSRPPAWAERLVDRLTRSPHLLGDLQEEFEDRCTRRGRTSAHLWYWRQAGRLLVALGPRALGLWMHPGELAHDIRTALRGVRRAPGLTTAGALTLGIGIGGPTALFGIVDGMFARLPVPHPERVVSIRMLDPASGSAVSPTAEAYAAWQAGVRGLSHVGAYAPDRVAIASEGVVPTRVASAQITPDVLTLLEVRPVRGRTFVDADLRGGAEPVALIREDVWRSTFGADPGILGRTLRVDGQPHTVVGVLPQDFGFPEQQRLWTAFDPSWDRTRGLRLVGRLAPDSEASAVAQAMAATMPALARADTLIPVGAAVQVEEYVVATLGVETRRQLWFLLTVVTSLVVIAAANVAALLLARGATRTSEVAVRIAMGAGRRRVIRQLMVEASALAGVGMVLGLAIAVPTLGAFARVMENRGSLPYWADFGLTPGVLGFTGALMLLATLASGVVPALRTSEVDLSAAMKAGNPRGGRSTGRLLPTLVGLEMALSCVLLILSGLVVKGALAQIQRPADFDLAGVLTGRIVLEDFAYPGRAARDRFIGELGRRLDEDGSIASFSFTSALPGDGSAAVRMQLAHRADEPVQTWPFTQSRSVGLRFFNMFSMSVRSGRGFTAADRERAPRVAVVNEAFLVERALDTDVVGRSVLIPDADGTPVAHEVVGVVTDPGVSVDDGRRVAAVFLPLRQDEVEGLAIAVRAASGDDAVARLRSHLAALDPDLPLERVMTLERVIQRENDGGRVFGLLFGGFGLAALVLAIVGLHGVVSFTAHQRRHEIGVMRALGAPRARVIRQTTGRGMRPVLIGLVAGIALSWLMSPMLGDGLFGTDARDPLVWTAVPLTLLVGGLLAAVGPALRAARADPARALRPE